MNYLWKTREYNSAPDLPSMSPLTDGLQRSGANSAMGRRNDLDSISAPVQQSNSNFGPLRRNIGVVQQTLQRNPGRREVTPYRPREMRDSRNHPQHGIDPELQESRSRLNAYLYSDVDPSDVIPSRSSGGNNHGQRSPFMTRITETDTSINQIDQNTNDNLPPLIRSESPVPRERTNRGVQWGDVTEMDDGLTWAMDDYSPSKQPPKGTEPPISFVTKDQVPKVDHICTICQDRLLKVDDPSDFKLAKTQCGHFYHIECINNWMEYGRNCPLCKALISHATE